MKDQSELRAAMAFAIDADEGKFLAGRYTSPTWFADLLQFSGVMDRVRTELIPTGYNSYPVLQITTGTPATRAISDTDPPAAADPALQVREITAHRLELAPIEISERLNYRLGGRLEGYIGEAISRKLLYHLESGLLTGTAANHQPLGLMSAGSTVREINGATTWAKIQEAIEDTIQSGAEPTALTWLLSTDYAKDLATTQQFASEGYAILKDGMIDEFPARRTALLPVGEGLLADWSEIVIGLFGQPEIRVDRSSQLGIIRVNAELDWGYTYGRLDPFTKVTKA